MKETKWRDAFHLYAKTRGRPGRLYTVRDMEEATRAISEIIGAPDTWAMVRMNHAQVIDKALSKLDERKGTATFKIDNGRPDPYGQTHSFYMERLPRGFFK